MAFVVGGMTVIPNVFLGKLQGRIHSANVERTRQNCIRALLYPCNKLYELLKKCCGNIKLPTTVPRFQTYRRIRFFRRADGCGISPGAIVFLKKTGSTHRPET